MGCVLPHSLYALLHALPHEDDCGLLSMIAIQRTKSRFLTVWAADGSVRTARNAQRGHGFAEPSSRPQHPSYCLFVFCRCLFLLLLFFYVETTKKRTLANYVGKRGEAYVHRIERFFLIIRTNEFIWPKKINYAPAHVPFVNMMMGAAVLLVPPFVDHGSVRSFEYCCIVSDMLCLFNIHFSFDILLNGIYLSYNYKGETVFFIP